jgi:hypothetical protein
MNIILTTEAPMWTDVWQTIAALIGIPATIVAFIILFIKDRNKENQINKLSSIADNLNKIAVDSERRYKISKKPYIEIKGEYLEEGFIGLVFINSNPNTSISDYVALDSKTNERVGFTHQARDSNGKQKMPLNIEAEEVPMGIKITVKYLTTEGFLYLQYMTVMIDEDYNVFVHQSPISHEDEES